MGKLNVFWYKVNDGSGNFGDELNKYLIAKLSGKNVRQILIPSSGIDYVYKSLLNIYHRVIPLKYIPKLIFQFFLKDIIVGIGSVISFPNSQSIKVWGSGIIRRDEKINKAIFCAVRGEYTRKRLLELGYSPPRDVGDPALLLPCVYHKKGIIAATNLGIIPHHTHLDTLDISFYTNNVVVIDLTKDIEFVIDQILSCHSVISSSLHGIIVPHAYGIPSLWVNFGGKKLYGDDIKFFDYFSSVKIDEYLPFDIASYSQDNIEHLFNNYESLSRINGNLDHIQKSLIASAPFKVIDRFLYV